MSAHRFLGKGVPAVQLDSLGGHFIALEGADCAGVTTAAARLRERLEHMGQAVVTLTLGTSALAGKLIDQAESGNALGRTTATMLYATDLADQMERQIIPSLRAGFVVLAERYIFTVMARAAVRGARADWLQRLFGFALVPDLTLFLSAPADARLERCLAERGTLDWWRAGMDMGLSPDLYTSFREYQRRLQTHYEHLARQHSFVAIDASGPMEATFEHSLFHIRQLIEGGKARGSA